VPSYFGDGSVDAYVPLFSRHMDAFKNCCYSLQD
jgi:shikimate O-hydroxycinnamoyltransferase